MLSAVAVAATGACVIGGVLAATGGSVSGGVDTTAVTSVGRPPITPAPVGAAPPQSAGVGTDAVGRAATVSRSDRREVADPDKEAALAQTNGRAMTQTEDLSDNDPREIGRVLLADFGWSSDQFGCLDSLWTKESGWRVYADNPSSSAYGIPQALPGSKMASAGSDWEDNPVTQITWGLGYIRDSYGSPCSAWSHSVGNNWY